MDIKYKLESVRLRIKKAADKSGRNPEDIKLVAATKYSDVKQIKEAISCGINCIGENRVQEASRKFQELPNVEKHMIGHLQTNKVKMAVKIFDCIQSVDSLKLAKEINKRAVDKGKIMPVFIEVNVSGEETKYGVGVDYVPDFYDKLVKLVNLRIDGLMTIAPYVKAEQTRPYFRKIIELNNQLKLKYLSMGMSNDFEVAIEEGSNMVRVGQAIFN